MRIRLEKVHKIIDGCMRPIVIADCPCRNRTEILKIRGCKDKYPIKESCFQLGAFGNYFLKRGEGKESSFKEAHELVDGFAKLEKNEFRIY